MRLNKADGVRATPFWRTVEDCLLRAPFRMALWRLPILRCGQRAYRDDFCERLRIDCEGKHGYRRAQVIASYADGLSENGGEVSVPSVLYCIRVSGARVAGGVS